MEFPPVASRVERWLTALMLAAALSVAWLESRSTLAQAARTGRPWLFWLALSEAREGAKPRLSLGLYRPERRTLDLIHVPGSLPVEGRLTLDQAYARALKEDGSEEEAARETAEAVYAALSPHLPSADLGAPDFLYAESADSGEAPAFAAQDWLEARSAGVNFWRALASPAVLRRPRLFAELKRLRPEGLRPAELPAEPQRREFFGRLFSSDPPAPPGEAVGTAALIVEILNASEAKGIASQATKILRLAGADVVSVGNAAPAAGTGRTVVYDRSGRIENAFWVRARLGCPTARVATRLGERRLTDATVVLAGDCRFLE